MINYIRLFFKKIKKLLTYLFQRRLIINPKFCYEYNIIRKKMLFHWQKMPPNYRWV